MVVERQAIERDIESVICHLRDVLSARVVTDAAGIVEEIHVLTEATRPPKQVVRDIESAIMAKLGIHVDHKKVSVAQIHGNSPRFEHARLKFSDVSISLNGSRAEATVRLSRDGEAYTGSATGMSSSQGQGRLIATATVRAIEDACGKEGTLVVEEVNTNVTMAGRQVALVLIDMVTERGEDFLIGASVIKQDNWKAVVNATLDALNRRLSTTFEE